MRAKRFTVLAVGSALVAVLAGGAILLAEAVGVEGEPEGGITSWSLTGNSGTTAGTHFLGTTDPQALEIHVSSSRALRIEPNSESPSIIAGHSDNGVTSGVCGAAIGGGGAAWVGNVVTDIYGTVSGGIDNQAGDGAGTTSDKGYATVGGGYGNDAAGKYATIGGGQSNNATGQYATIGGGENGEANGDKSTVAGGGANAASADYATIAGGRANAASGYYATISGGRGNTASNSYATVAGGRGNKASRHYTTVAGGYVNQATGLYAGVGGGQRNKATQDCATVAGGESNLADANYATVGGGRANTTTGYYATAAGGRGNTASQNYATVGGGRGNTANGYYATVLAGRENRAAGNYSLATGYRAKVDASHDGATLFADGTNVNFNSSAANEFAARCTGGARFVSAVNGSGTPTAGVTLAAGGGSWSSISDRNAKRDFKAVDKRELLARLAKVPITTWGYKTQDASIRHIGPMAQDFHATFGVGEDDKHITTIDAHGVALGAIQGLHDLLKEKDARIRALKAEIGVLKEQDAKVEVRFAKMEAIVTGLAKTVKER